ncbi:MAG: hypothetical protein ABI026_05940 [Gemmatimonadaceae bacterium]
MSGIAAACGGSEGAQTQRAPKATPVTAPSPPRLASNEGTTIVDGHAIIRQDAVGPLRVGEWRRPVMSFVYVVSAHEEKDSTAIIVVRGIGKDTVTLAFSNDTLRRILVTRPGARTSDGIQVGTRFDSVTARRGATTVDRGKARVTSLDGLCGVRFATDSAALSPDSIVRKPAPGAATVRAIAVDFCKK